MAADNDDEILPLFIEAKDSSARSIISDIPHSLLQSIERVRHRHFSTATTNGGDASSNENLLKQLVELTNSKKKVDTEPLSDDDGSLSYPQMERVPGCIATVHVKTTLIPTTTSSSDNPKEYRVLLEGTSDALLSGGLVELLSQVLAGSDTENGHEVSCVTASDVLKLKPEALTTALGLQNVLSRGRNDGMASMVRVVQRQIQSLLDAQSGEEAKQPSGENMETSLQTSNANGSERQPTVAMLLSGGVDSSVAMHLLLRQNYNVTAFYLRIWLEDELAHLGECPWEDDLQVCQSVCEHAGNVTLETVSLGKEYRERVVQYTIEEAQRGRTPNPDIMCNSRIKFGCFLEYIEKAGLDFDYVASGHYARLEDVVTSSTTTTSTQKRLFRAPDPIKDQSYFLCALTQKQLSKVIFPIGMYQKAEVRELANEFQLPNRNRPDSQGLCFLGKVKFDEFLASYLGNRPGDVVDAMTGDIIGRHNGLWYHTVGQRKGIGKVMFPLATAHGPWYVVAKDQERDIVYVSNRYDEDDFARARSEFELEDIKWISGTPPLDAKDTETETEWNEIRFDMKIRHGPKIVQGSLILNGDGSTGNVRLDNKDGGLAPGQYVVFYQIGTLECLGAGVISEKHWAKFLQTQQNEMATGEEQQLEIKR
jgi:tRNA (5-methylaminomethyl-2-thiouridylate)-methyltransferase